MFASTGRSTAHAGASQTDIVTVTGTGNGQTVTATDDAIVSTGCYRLRSVSWSTRRHRRLRGKSPGGDFTFTVVVTNPGTVPLTITALTDNIYGDIGAPSATSTCDDLIGTVSRPGATAPPCTFTGPFNGVAGASQTDIVTVIGTDQFGQTATDNDDATVTLTRGPTPLIRVDKTVSPATRSCAGWDFTFSVVVSNPGTVPVVITSLVDDVYGNLATLAEPNTCDDLIGDTLAPGASTAPCSFTVTFNGVASDTQTDIVTVIGHRRDRADGNGQRRRSHHPFPDAPRPALDPAGQDGNAGAPVRSPVERSPSTWWSPTPATCRLTITSLIDDIYGNLATRSGVNTCDDLIGDVLAPGASANCSFQGEFTGNAGDSQTDVVTVTGRDADGRTVDDDDDAEVELTDVLPQFRS